MVSLTAVIVETRQVKNLEEIIQGHMNYLPSDTQLVIYYGNENSYLKTKFPNAIFVESRVNTENDYNDLLTTTVFWEGLKANNRVLIFQHDSMLLREGIEEFYEWDYVGARWSFPPYRGNGGLSLRNPNVMLDICRNNKYNLSQHGNEDVFFCNIMNNGNQYKLAPVEVCDKFAVESIFSLGSMGVHAIDKYLSESEYNQIKNQYK